MLSEKGYAIVHHHPPSYPSNHQAQPIIPDNKFFLDIPVVNEGCFLLLFLTLLIKAFPNSISKPLPYFSPLRQSAIL
jgi:hypothetical protein